MYINSVPLCRLMYLLHSRPGSEYRNRYRGVDNDADFIGYNTTAEIITCDVTRGSVRDPCR